MAKNNGWYYKWSHMLRIILAIIPFTSYFVHAIVRITSGKISGIVLGLISLFLGVGLIMWIVDLICMIINRPLICG